MCTREEKEEEAVGCRRRQTKKMEGRIMWKAKKILSLMHACTHGQEQGREGNGKKKNMEEENSSTIE